MWTSFCTQIKVTIMGQLICLDASYTALYQDNLANHTRMFQEWIYRMITEPCGLVKPISDFFLILLCKYAWKYIKWTVMTFIIHVIILFSFFCESLMRLHLPTSHESSSSPSKSLSSLSCFLSSFSFPVLQLIKSARKCFFTFSVN